MLQEINKELLVSLNSLTQYDFVKTIVLYFADSPIFFLPIFLAFFWIYYTYKKDNISNSKVYLAKNLLAKENLIYIFYSVVLGIIINILIQHMIYIERPEAAIKGVGLLVLKHIPDASFPSDHATVSVAFLTSLFFAGYKRIGLYFTVFVILMLFSRVIGGIHWPFDIIVGSLVGIFSSFIVFKYFTKIDFVSSFNRFIIKIMGYIKL